MRLGQVQELLDAGAQAHAEPLAAAEGDQRVRQLVALAQRIGPRIEEGGEALQRGTAPPRRCAPSANGSSSREAEEQAPVEAAEEQDAERDRHDHDERAEVGLEQQQAADRHHHRRTAAGSRATSVCCSGCSACRNAALRTA